MDQLEELIKDERNKEEIADLIYQRYFNRYLKLFTYQSTEPPKAYYSEGGKSNKMGNEFDVEYKSGFIIMTTCCLLIETIAAFFKGIDRTPNNGGIEAFTIVFAKAIDYNNLLSKFRDEPIYSKIRNGLLHQGETYGKFLIRREGELFDKDNKAINATLFARHLKEFLQSYREDLKTSAWDDDIWKNCRDKLKHIIHNSRQDSRQ